MNHEITPIPVRPWTLNGLSERLVVSHCISRTVHLMEGAVWRDPDRVEEWVGELSTDQPVAVYCAYGFHVGCNVTRALRERGLDARDVRGGVSAWYAAGGARAMQPAGGPGGQP
jgi:Fe-Mn family superoxide dismutase